MVSGVEAAGLVLGSIPLVLAGLKFYAEGIAVTKRFWKYREGFRQLVVDLQTEHTMCINSINMLLTGVVSQKEIAELLADPGGKRWKDQKFGQQLKQRLTTSYVSYLELIQQLNAVADEFKTRLKLTDAGYPQFTEKNAIKDNYKRLKFSLNKSDYDDLMARLRQANSSLYRMTSQTTYLQARQTSKLDRRSIPNFSVIQSRAQSFYSALDKSWNCPCQSDHSVSLRLEPRIEDGSSDDDEEDEDSMRDLFHVLFRYAHTHSTASNSISTVAPWTWEEADVRITCQQKMSIGVASCSRGSGRGVRFESRARRAVHAALDPHPNLQPIQNLCSAICSLQKPQRDVCFSLLANEIAKQQYGILIYPIQQLPLDTDTWTLSSLGTVLEDSSFARRDRLQLAVTLASSVLQLHDTPWLADDWNKENIFFVKKPGTCSYSQPFVSQQFNGASRISTANLPSSMSRIIRNQSLYALGVALIELWYGKTLSELHKAEDGLLGTGDAQNDFLTRWNTADRLVDELYNEAGGKYSDAVRRCIRCDFGQRVSKLEDVQFQRAVYQDVVTQLEENYKFLFQ